MVRARLGDARGDCADANLRYQFYRYASGFVYVLEVEDQLRQVLDRIDVVVRRGRDQPDAGRRMADSRNMAVDLVSRKLAAFAGLRALRDLDLQLVGVDQIFGRHPKTTGCDLLDRRAK